MHTKQLLALIEETHGARDTYIVVIHGVCYIIAQLQFWTSSAVQRVTGFLCMWACMGSFGKKRDCQARRNRSFNRKYCWCLTFQVNKQQSAYGAGFSSVLIRLGKFKSLRWEPSPVILFRVCFCALFNSRWAGATVCVYVCVHACLQCSSVFICQKCAFWEWAGVWLWKQDNMSVAPFLKKTERGQIFKHLTLCPAQENS